MKDRFHFTEPGDSADEANQRSQVTDTLDSVITLVGSTHRQHEPRLLRAGGPVGYPSNCRRGKRILRLDPPISSVKSMHPSCAKQVSEVCQTTTQTGRRNRDQSPIREAQKPFRRSGKAACYFRSHPPHPPHPPQPPSPQPPSPTPPPSSLHPR